MRIKIYSFFFIFPCSFADGETDSIYNFSFPYQFLNFDLQVIHGSLGELVESPANPAKYKIILENCELNYIELYL